MLLRLTALCLLCTAGLCARASADASGSADAEAPGLGASARVVRPLASTNREDASASGTEIDTRERVAAHETVSDVLLEVSGSRPFRTGALGSFTSASLRGAEVEHTAVLFGDIPISSADAAAFNLSTIPLSLLDRVVVYRGGAPAWLSQGAIGGVIQLVPRSAQGTTLAATATAGTLGTYGISAQSSVAPPGEHAPSLLASAGVLGSSGDFSFKYDNKTSFDTSDDFVTQRKNADFIDGQGLLRLNQPLGGGALEVLLLGLSRVGGEPGSPADPALRARHDFTRGLFGLGYTYDREDAHGERVLRLQALAVTSFERSRVTDLYAEVDPAGPTDADSLGTRALGRLAGTLAVSDFLELTLIGSAQREGLTTDDPFARPPLPASARTSVAATVEALLHGEIGSHRLELRPSARLERGSAALHSVHFGSAVAHELDTTLPTYRLAAALELLRDLTLSASVASGARTPSMLELFGDGALIVGNAALEPEHSTSYDVGLVESTCNDQLSGSFELRAFELEIADQILFIRNSFSQLVPENLLHSRIRGLESGLRALFGSHLWLNAAATLLSTEGKPDKQLPNRPAFVAFLQPGVTLRSLGAFDALQAFVESSFTSQSYDDPDNQTPPKRSILLFGAGTALSFMRKHAELRLTLNDIFDRHGEDLRHFPLPGRTVMASLTYREGT